MREPVDYSYISKHDNKKLSAFSVTNNSYLHAYLYYKKDKNRKQKRNHKEAEKILQIH